MTAEAQTCGFFGDAGRGVLVEWIGLFWIERSEERKLEEARGVADAVEVGASECVLAVHRGASCSPERSYLNGRQIWLAFQCCGWAEDSRGERSC